MLAWNQQKTRQLTPVEIWLFIAGRVFVAFGLGLLAARHLPWCADFGWPSVALGAALLILAARGLLRGARPSAP